MSALATCSNTAAKNAANNAAPTGGHKFITIRHSENAALRKRAACMGKSSLAAPKTQISFRRFTIGV